jgi:predicted RNase H-like HicB family nuclease
MINMEFEIVLEKQKAGGFTVYVPKLPGCISQGDSKEKAIANIKEAIELYLEDLKEGELEQLQHNVEITKTAVKIDV